MRLYQKAKSFNSRVRKGFALSSQSVNYLQFDFAHFENLLLACGEKVLIIWLRRNFLS